MYVVLLFLAFIGCMGKTDSDSPATDSPTDTGGNTGTSSFTCATPEIHVNGEDPPTVGDAWDVFLWCGSALMTGATIVSVTPDSLADIEKYHVTWTNAGTGTLTVQVGSYKGEREVEVSP